MTDTSRGKEDRGRAGQRLTEVSLSTGESALLLGALLTLVASVASFTTL